MYFGLANHREKKHELFKEGFALLQDSSGS